MLIRDQMAKSGDRLFRWRSYLPLAFMPFILWSVLQGEQIETRYGDLTGDLIEWLAVLMVAAGEALRIATVGFVPRGTSGRNTTGQIASVLNTTGIYSLVRNPLYLGNCLMYLGVALFTQSVLLALAMAMVLMFYYERIIAAEEAFLADKFGAVYTDWAARTPAFIPRLSGWVPSDLTFSLRSVIRREHPSVYGAILMLVLVELGLHLLGRSTEPFEPGWLWIIAVASVIEIAVIFAKKRTRLLNAPGR